jgi:hypothetical protein
LVVGRLTVPNIESRCNQLKLGHSPKQSILQPAFGLSANRSYPASTAGLVL